MVRGEVELEFWEWLVGGAISEGERVGWLQAALRA